MRRSSRSFFLALVLLALPHAASAQEPAPAPAPALAPAPAPVVAACAPDWRKTAYLGARDAVVRIEMVGMAVDHLETVAGFVYPSRSHVVAVNYAAGVGRGVKVHFANGKVIGAHAVTLDEAKHLAILKLDEEAPVAPLHVTDRPIEVGEELVNVVPFDGVSAADPNRVVSDADLLTGRISTVGDRVRLRFDGSTPLAFGAPLVGCDGSVVAIRGWSALVPGSDIRAMVPRDTPADDKHWSLLHLHVGLLTQFDTRTRIGGTWGLAAVYADRFQLRLSTGILAGPRTPAEQRREINVKDDVVRLQAETTVGYRFLVADAVPTYLVPQIGVVGRVDLNTKHRTTATLNDVGCIARGGPCPIDLTRQTTSSSHASARPVVGLGVIFGALGLSYQFQLDPSTPSSSTHQVQFGVEF